MQILDSGIDNERWMREALREAEKCLRHPPNPQPLIPTRQSEDGPVSEDVPVGAICVLQNEIIGRGHNRRETDRDPTSHAEILAIREAARHLDSWRLETVSLYVTLEPCPMCAGAIWLSRLRRVVFGAWDERAGACGSLFDILRDPRLNHRLELRGGVLEAQCAALLTEFFAARRQ